MSSNTSKGEKKKGMTGSAARAIMGSGRQHGRVGGEEGGSKGNRNGNRNGVCNNGIGA